MQTGLLAVLENEAGEVASVAVRCQTTVCGIKPRHLEQIPNHLLCHRLR